MRKFPHHAVWPEWWGNFLLIQVKQWDEEIFSSLCCVTRMVRKFPPNPSQTARWGNFLITLCDPNGEEISSSCCMTQIMRKFPHHSGHTARWGNFLAAWTRSCCRCEEISVQRYVWPVIPIFLHDHNSHFNTGLKRQSVLSKDVVCQWVL